MKANSLLPLEKAFTRAADSGSALSERDCSEIVRLILRQPTLSLLSEKCPAFPILRSSLLQTRQLSTLITILNAIRSHASALGEKEPAQLAKVLLFNAYWHTGELDQCDLLRREIDVSAPSLHWALFQLFRAVERQLTANYRESLHLLKELRHAPAEQVREAERFIGVEFDFAISTWALWNRIELMDYDDLYIDLEASHEIGRKQRHLSNKTLSLYYLALGFFQLVHRALCLARQSLQIALEHAELDGSLWRARILSTLCMCEHRLGHREESMALLNASLETLSSHFGPVGWMLNIVDGLSCNQRLDEARALLPRVIEGTSRKGEFGNQVWCQVMALEIGLSTPDGPEAKAVFEKASSLEMRRACQHLIVIGAV
jgi:hypothetical protein